MRLGICCPLTGLGSVPWGGTGGATTVAWKAEVCLEGRSALRFARSESSAARTAVRSSKKWSKASLPG